MNPYAKVKKLNKATDYNLDIQYISYLNTYQTRQNLIFF